MAHSNFLQAQSQVSHVDLWCVLFIHLYQKLRIKHGYKTQNNFLRFWSFPSSQQALNFNPIHRGWLSSYRLVFIDVILQGEKEEDTFSNRNKNLFKFSKILRSWLFCAWLSLQRMATKCKKIPNTWVDHFLLNIPAAIFVLHVVGGQ